MWMDKALTLMAFHTGIIERDRKAPRDVEAPRSVLSPDSPRRLQVRKEPASTHDRRSPASEVLNSFTEYLGVTHQEASRRAEQLHEKRLHGVEFAAALQTSQLPNHVHNFCISISVILAIGRRKGTKRTERPRTRIRTCSLLGCNHNHT